MNPRPLEVIMEELRNGDFAAVEDAFLAYEPYLRMVVRRRLSRRLRAKFDSADVVQSVWVHVLADLQAAGRQIDDTVHLRNFLVQVARRCLTDRLRHFRTSLEHEQPLGTASGNHVPASPEPRPSEFAEAGDLWEKMLVLCPPAHHELLRLKRQGLSLAEIAARTGLHQDSVRRIFRRLARQLAFQDNRGLA